MKFIHYPLATLIATSFLIIANTSSQALTIKAVEWSDNRRVAFDVNWGPNWTSTVMAYEDFHNNGSPEYVEVIDHGTHLEVTISISHFAYYSGLIFTFVTTDRLPQNAQLIQIPSAQFNPEECEDNCGYGYEPGIFDNIEQNAKVYPGGKKIPGPKGLSLGRHGARFVLGNDYTGYPVSDASSTMATLGLGLGVLTIVRRRFQNQRG